MIRARFRRLAPALAAATLLFVPLAGAAEDPEPPKRNYFVYVCAESDDTVHLLRFGPTGFVEMEKIAVGSFPTETEGPHGINISPDGRYWFLSIAHGMPFGSVHKYETGTNEWLGDATLGMFPATMDISPSTGLLYVVNFNLHGDMVPSTISVVETGTMIEVATIDTGGHAARRPLRSRRQPALLRQHDGRRTGGGGRHALRDRPGASRSGPIPTPGIRAWRAWTTWKGCGCRW